MLGIGPLIWEQVQESEGRTYSEAAPWPRQGGETRIYSGRYYRAIDAVTRGERRLPAPVNSHCCVICKRRTEALRRPFP